ncbi:dihydrolipoamide acetyltransferase family protein [Mycobacterium branderi]|uniref:Dihydrolipoamide acetyltransferase component of pyruvate dehydrogenase complex n=1 Tax=Mycobacterium branderi TaxID=43348 RepID=A0A7I7W8L1_9MYCO|nr:dihydrolipoamide acetyltransferase family protein [Mycobacterium branderi]MCV7234282.1 2-oxo acid dehydrogenase subunit E2 [Mycobacterium branderi]ORA38351.1 branched-chain alpha-keto acid dehydrogenase subunit E2 [Mycobacterium branderi]BBZ13125.1 dihydrolipoamide acetyltransferase component of pyruvate dehydrogenase complex [Mycobacterium branderi]
MSVKPFVVPDLGEGLEEVTLSNWNVAVGDDVEINQPLCSVETAKAEVEIPSPYAGRIVEIHGAEGDVLPVGALLVRIDTASGAPSNGESPTRTPVLVGYGADDTLDASRRPKAKPSVRKLAAELGVDLTDVPPGPDGLISREAVLAAAEHADVSYDVLPVRGVQAEMARRMTLAHSQIPDAHASVQVDCTNLLRLHDRLQVTPFALTLRFVALALQHHTILNSTWVDGPDGPQVHTHRAVHLGFAVAAPRGLLVPVVADAHQMTTRQLADAVARLTEQARAGTLKPAQLTGSTFTVSNFGALGLDEGVPVINYPEAAILGMGSLKPRPMALDDQVVVRPQMTLTCAFDHRVADGAQVAAFLGELRGLLESPETALLDL